MTPNPAQTSLTTTTPPRKFLNLPRKSTSSKNIDNEIITPHDSSGILSLYLPSSASPRKITATPTSPNTRVSTPYPRNPPQLLLDSSPKEPQPMSILSPSSNRRSKRGAVKQRNRIERLVAVVPSGICGDDSQDSPNNNNRLNRSKNNGVTQRHGRRTTKRLEKEKKDEHVAVDGAEDTLSKSVKSGDCANVDDVQGSLDGESDAIASVRNWVSELIMWKDVSKSSLWFGVGSLFFLAFGFSKGVDFSIVSAASQVGLLVLALAFCHDSLLRSAKNQSDEDNGKKPLLLSEDEVIRVAKTIAPLVNAIIFKMRELFSGDPSLTFKMAPVMYFASEYGHLLTLWRVLTVGFFTSFTIPKFYDSYSHHLHSHAEYIRECISERWFECSHKRTVVALAVIVFWNLASLKTRLFVVFMCVVFLRLHREYLFSQSEAETTVECEEVAANDFSDKEK